MRLSYFKKFLVVLIAMIFVVQGVASASVPYQVYNYNETYEGDVAAASGYIPDRIIDGNTLGIGKLSNTTDIFVSGNEIYVIDSGNNRIVVINQDFSFNRTIQLKNKDGQIIKFSNEQGKGAQGIFVDKVGKRLFTSAILDAQGGVVYVNDLDGNFITTIERPKTDVIPANTMYKPTNVIVDEAGMIYVCAGMTNGTLQFDANYNFKGFYGYQSVALTPQVVIEMFWRKFILNDDQIDRTEQLIPTIFESFDLAKDGSIYTVANTFTDNDSVGQDQALKLNPLGNNILKYKGETYGDRMLYYDPQLGTIRSNLVDIAVDDDEFFYILDSKRGRVFMYDQNSMIISIFGGSNATTHEKQLGTFQAPAAVDTIGEYILVTDEINNNITVFKQTEYMKNVRMATKLDEEGLYEESGPYWMAASKYDAFNLTVNSGIGRYYKTIGDYDKALEFATKSFSWMDYSIAFKEYRDKTASALFPFILIAIVLLIMIPIIITQVKAKKRKSTEEYTIHRNKKQYLKYCLFHPFKAYGDMKYEKMGSVTFAGIIVGVLVVIEIMSRTMVGFMVNPSVAKILYFNLTATIISTIGGFFLWTLCNWAITTLFDGEGRFSEIWTFTAYAFLPRIVCMIPYIILSRFITMDEIVFLQMLEWFMYLWIAVSVIMAIKEVHQYSMKKTILSIIFTLIGMILVICITAIVYSMFVQLVSFVSNIFSEINLRL